MIRLGTFRRETLASLSVFFILAATIIWVRTTTVKETYLYVQQEKELKRAQDELQSLRVAWGRVTSPGKLQATAAALGMVAPVWSQVMKYRSSFQASGQSSGQASGRKTGGFR